MFKWAQKPMIVFFTRLVGFGAIREPFMDLAEKVPPCFQGHRDLKAQVQERRPRIPPYWLPNDKVNCRPSKLNCRPFKLSSRQLNLVYIQLRRSSKLLESNCKILESSWR
uniref:Uncharacterized protein n=1 Tax=Opuntia streptacantha TaxID=393608 RepID=A0A7C9CYB6_OPUST